MNSGEFQKKKNKNKYRAVKTIVDGIRFDSRKEAARYGQLKFLEKHGKIRNLHLQTRFELAVKGFHICSYVADFTYYNVGLDVSIVEDVKGFKTPIYKLKKKLVEALYGVKVLET